MDFYESPGSEGYLVYKDGDETVDLTRQQRLENADTYAGILFYEYD